MQQLLQHNSRLAAWQSCTRHPTKAWVRNKCLLRICGFLFHSIIVAIADWYKLLLTVVLIHVSEAMAVCYFQPYCYLFSYNHNARVIPLKTSSATLHLLFPLPEVCHPALHILGFFFFFLFSSLAMALNITSLEWPSLICYLSAIYGGVCYLHIWTSIFPFFLLK